MRSWQISLLFFLGLLLVWEALFRLGLWPPYVFPSPSSVVRALIDGFASGYYLRAAATSMRRIVIGYGISILVGIPTGLLLGRSRVVQATVGPLAIGLQALPSICWLPLALLWFGLGERAILFVVVMGALLSIVLSTADGVQHLPSICGSPTGCEVPPTAGSSSSRCQGSYRWLGWSFAAVADGELLHQAQPGGGLQIMDAS
jgi:NitT/TauT family transport system permease protein